MAAVSIIIPTFNRARFLGTAIDSALAQGAGVEVIVVDDGSTDGTAGLLEDFGERIRLLHQSNAGPSAARNHGAAKASGDFLFFLDSDDLIEHGAIDRLLVRARALGPERIAFGTAVTVDEGGQLCEGPAYGFPLATPGEALSLPTLLGGTMSLWLGLIPADAFRSAGGLRPDLRLGEDQELALRIHSLGLLYVATGIAVTRVRMHGGPRLSGSTNPDFGARAIQLWSLIRAALDGTDDFDTAGRQALASVIWGSGREAARAGDRASADALFALAQSVDEKMEAAGPTPLRMLGKAIGPYRAERAVMLAKRALRRS